MNEEPEVLCCRAIVDVKGPLASVLIRCDVDLQLLARGVVLFSAHWESASVVHVAGIFSLHISSVFSVCQLMPAVCRVNTGRNQTAAREGERGCCITSILESLLLTVKCSSLNTWQDLLRTNFSGRFMRLLLKTASWIYPQLHPPASNFTL